ncbi:hypothetical protein B0J14DRAFT_610909 [Halenospora varia]|nr:hypothetical protein B0J14DRAFT_610909 [Halenospora varia]
MGLSNDIKWYQLLALYIAVGSHDMYRYSINKAAEFTQTAYWKTSSALDLNHVLPTNLTDSEILHQKNTEKSVDVIEQFQRLPMEIRLLIWRFASCQSRVVEIRQPRIQRNGPLFRGGEGYSICAIPPTLHICRESRHEALKHYSLNFRINDDLMIGKGIYINCDTDVVYFGRKCDFYDLMHSSRLGVVGGMEKIQYFGFGERLIDQLRDFDWGVLKDLKEVIIIGNEKGEKMFQLGRSPQLETGNSTDFDWEDKTSLRLRGMDHWIQMFNMSIMAREEAQPGWTAPMVRFGTFRKGRGDKWYLRNQFNNLGF